MVPSFPYCPVFTLMYCPMKENPHRKNTKEQRKDKKFKTKTKTEIKKTCLEVPFKISLNTKAKRFHYRKAMNETPTAEILLCNN